MLAQQVSPPWGGSSTARSTVPSGGHSMKVPSLCQLSTREPRAAAPLYLGEVKVIKDQNPLSEVISFQHSADLGGKSASYQYDWRISPPDANAQTIAIGATWYLAKLAVGGFLLALFETSIAKMRVFRVPAFLGAALMLGLLATLLLFVSRSL